MSEFDSQKITEVSAVPCLEKKEKHHLLNFTSIVRRKYYEILHTI